MSTQMDKIINLYKSIAQIPSLSSAKISCLTESRIIVQSNWTQRNLERCTNQKFSIDYTLTQNFDVITETFPIDITSELLSAVSDDGEYRAVLKSALVSKDKNAVTKQFIEIWSKQCLLKNYDLSALDVHGDVYTDGEFGSFEWSHDGNKLLYIAEKKPAKSEPFYKQQPLKNKDENKEEIIKGNEYIYKPDWGEQLVGKQHPVVVVLDTISNLISVLTQVPDNLSLGQVIWAPNDNAIIGVAWIHEPRHLGLMFCTNRQSWIFQHKDGKFEKISADNCSVRSPRFSKDNRHLVWLERDVSGPHHHAHRLMHLNWEDNTKTPDILIDIVRQSINIDKGKLFYGLYNQKISQNCWSNDSKYLFFKTPQRSNVRSYALNIETKVLTEIENDQSSLSFLDAKNNILLFAKTSLIQPTYLIMGRFDNKNPSKINFNNVSLPIKLINSEKLKYEPIEYVYDNDEQVRDFNFIYYGPNEGDIHSHPLIIMPHGGPHSAYANNFTLESSLLALLGFGLLQVNYRGSIGMGADNVEYLQGRVGNVDVKDCVTATQEALKKYSWLNSEKIGLSGGSHGGFLVAHLSGQYSDLYKVVVARNPVIDVAAMFTISDIPDWCAAIINESYRQSFSNDDKTFIDAEEMVLKMFKCSPIVHVDKVKAPTLMCVGKNDLRVPMSQGQHWYHRLKANGIPTKMLVYDDNHPLSSGPVEIDDIINAALWFTEHLKVTKYYS
ncbi:hypothetical protein PV328_009110 [Microctonus aethiopoides]|uniref:acylaminoacyl-peptidase n=1 Tax=Microctonus aethiopoides TaxID=144406 RepID=A0AA39KRS6_9HYME|nr:hypothetical protein PV328_009110 [Microctonus aethiopoides]